MKSASNHYLFFSDRLAVGNALLMLTLTEPFFCVLRTTRRARPFHVLVRGEVYGSVSFRSAEAKANRFPAPLTIASQSMAASGTGVPCLSRTSTVMNVSD